jgi:hypothetical protein
MSKHIKTEAVSYVTIVWQVIIRCVANIAVHSTHTYGSLQHAAPKCNNREHLYDWRVTLTESACQLKTSVFETYEPEK